MHTPSSCLVSYSVWLLDQYGEGQTTFESVSYSLLLEQNQERRTLLILVRNLRTDHSSSHGHGGPARQLVDESRDLAYHRHMNYGGGQACRALASVSSHAIRRVRARPDPWNHAWYVSVTCSDHNNPRPRAWGCKRRVPRWGRHRQHRCVPQADKRQKPINYFRNQLKMTCSPNLWHEMYNTRSIMLTFL